uniref:Mobile element transfer n=1 Tax=Streptomyces sp. NBC_01393 TaxID=2903851 RepID=A0AAU3HXU0_9ACTN
MEHLDETDPPSGHRTTTVDQGAFCLARCTCGWRGPARRARSQARTDADKHGTG